MNEPNKEQQEELKKKHERTKRKLKIIGIIVAVAGLGFTVMGFVDMISSTSKGEMPALFWGLIVGLPMLGIGGMLCLTGFRREITRYMKNESVPVINETGREIAPAVSAIAGAVKDSEGNVCPHCGNPNDENAVFCRHCGGELLVTCPSCKEKVKNGKFCDKCGKPLH